MTSPKLSFDTEFGRFYRHPAARKVSTALGNMFLDESVVNDPHSPNPSITNIMKMMDEGFLPGYHGKLIAEYAATNIGDLVNLDEAELIQTLRAVPNQPHPNAAIGTNIHGMIDALHKGEPIPDGETITARRMFAQYLHFLKEVKPSVLRTEFTVWSYEHGYAGTGDIAYRINGMPWIVDFKSGNNTYPKVGMQNAAIQNADVVLNEDGTEEEMFNAAFLGVIHIRPMSIKLYQLEHEAECFQAFLACKRLFDWVRYYKQSVIPASPRIETKKPAPILP